MIPFLTKIAKIATIMNAIIDGMTVDRTKVISWLSSSLNAGDEVSVVVVVAVVAVEQFT